MSGGSKTLINLWSFLGIELGSETYPI